MPGRSSSRSRERRRLPSGDTWPTESPSTTKPDRDTACDRCSRVPILYFSDARFPIERANGVQTMATCHALAARGHTVTLVVRPDTETPARDPFAFYDLPRLPKLRIETIRGPRSPRARRARF